MLRVFKFPILHGALCSRLLSATEAAVVHASATYLMIQELASGEGARDLLRVHVVVA